MKQLITKLCALLAGTLALTTFAAAQTDPPVWSPTASYKIGNIVSYGGINFQCLINETNTHPNPHEPGGWAINYVYSGNVTVPVGPGAACPSLTSAWNYIKYARIATGSTITLSLENTYSESFTGSFSLDHPFGSQIRIIGTNSGQVANFTGTKAGFVLDSGHAFGELAGLKIVAPTGGTAGNPGLLVSQRAELANLINVSMQNFDIGILADSGQIDGVSNVTTINFKDGVEASGANALINIISAIAIDGSSSSSVPEAAFKATLGGSINCPKCAGNNCAYGFYAVQNGAIYCASATATGPQFGAYLYGFLAQNHGSIYAASASSTGFAQGSELIKVDSFTPQPQVQTAPHLTAIHLPCCRT